MSNARTRPSFTAVYRQHRDAIYSYVLYRVDRNRAVAEDIVSDVFLKAYERYDTYDPTYAVTTWLYTIARNTLIDHYRRGRHVVDIDDLPVADTDDPLFVLLTRELTLAEVEAAIAALPEAQRRCITEQFFAGKTGATIAAETGYSHAAVRKHVSRGIAALRARLLVGFIALGAPGSTIAALL